MDNWFKSKWFVRVASLAFAIILYVFVHVDQNSTQSNAALPGLAKESETLDDVPVEIRIDEENYVVTGVPEFVTVSLSGPPSVLRPTVVQRNFSVFVDLKGLEEGEHVVEIEHNITDELDVFIEPKSVEVYIEERASAEFPISVEFINKDQFPPGYELGSFEIKPEVVTITSSRTVIDQVKIVKVFVDVAGLTEPIRNREVPINVYDGQGNELNVRLDPETVVVSAEINNPSKTVSVEVPTVGELPEGYELLSITPSVEEIEIFGTSNVLETVSSIATEELNLSEIRESGTVELKLALPEGIIVPDVESIEVSIEIKETRVFRNVPIEVRGIDEEQFQFIQPENGQLDVTITGNQSVTKEVLREEIIPYVTVQQSAAGEISLPVAVEIPNMDDLTVELDVEEVTIEIAQ